MNKKLFDKFVDMIWKMTCDTFPDANSVVIEVTADGSVVVEPEFNTFKKQNEWFDFCDEYESDCDCCDCGSCGCCDD